MEYMPSVAGQAAGFFYSAGLGFALGLVYDFFRIFFYMLTGSDKKLSVTRDIMYLLCCLAVNFIFLLVMCSGRLMFYVFAGEGIGLIAYFRTLGSETYPRLKRSAAGIRRSFVKLFVLSAKIKLFFLKFRQIRHKNAKKQEKISKNT